MDFDSKFFVQDYSFKVRALAWKMGINPANFRAYGTKTSDFDRAFIEATVNEYQNHLKEKHAKGTSKCLWFS